jgi:hypothetical protein
MKSFTIILLVISLIFVLNIEGNKSKTLGDKEDKETKDVVAEEVKKDSKGKEDGKIDDANKKASDNKKKADEDAKKKKKAEGDGKEPNINDVKSFFSDDAKKSPFQVI